MCNYSGSHFGSGYPDAVCIDGYLWDADSCDAPGGPLFSGGEIPCPQCSREEWLEHGRERVEEEGFIAFEEGSQANPYASCRLKFEEDRDFLTSAWQRGYDEAVASAKSAADMIRDCSPSSAEVSDAATSD